jgi:chromosome segregation ATPase
MGMQRKFTSPKIVSAQQRVPLWLRLLLVLLLLLTVAWVAYQQGSDVSTTFVGQQSADAKDRIEALVEERNALRRELTMVKQEAEIDRGSIQSIRDQIKQFQDERLKMEEELAFLRGIVSTDAKKHALRVQNFKLEQGLEAGQYIYKFSVSQVINSNIIAKGVIELNIEGLQDGRTKRLSLAQVSQEKLERIKMRFRYFQNVEGKLRLPDGFEPATIEIHVKPSGKKLQPIKASYNWSPFS